MNDNQKRSAHFLGYLGVLEKIHPIRGGSPDSPFTVLEISPTGTKDSGKRVGWTYITSGMSTAPQPCKDNWVCPPNVNLELMLYCRRQSEQAIQTLEELANFPYDAGSCLAHGQVLPTDEPAEHGWTGYVLMNPHREHAEFSPLPFQIEGREVQVLWVFPLLPLEVEYATLAGGDVMEELVQAQAPKPFLDLARKTTVTQADVDEARAKKEKARIEREQAQAGADKKKTAKRKFALTGIFGRGKEAESAADAPAATPLPDPTRGAAVAPKAKPKEREPEAVSLEEAVDRLAAAKESERAATALVRSLQADIQALQENLREIRPAIKELEEKRSGTAGSRKELHLTLKDAQAELAKEEQRLAAATKQLDEAAAARDAMALAVTAAEAECRQREEESSAAQDSIQQVEERVTALTTDLGGAQEEAELAEQEATELQEKAEELRRQAEAAAVAAAKAAERAKAARAGVEAQRSELDELGGRGSALRAKAERANSSVAGAAKSLEEKQGELALQEAKVAELAEKTNPDTRRFDELTKTVTILADELAAADSAIGAADQELQTLRSSKSQAVVQEQKLDSKIQNTLLAADQAREELERAQKVFDRLEAIALEEARKEADAAQAQVEEMQRALEQAKAKAEQKLREVEGRAHGTASPEGADAASDSEGAKSKRRERLQIIKDSMMKDKEP